MTRAKQLTPQLKTAILELRKVGLSGVKIAQQLGFSHTSVGNFLRRYDATGDANRQKSSGRPRKSDADNDAVLEELSLGDRWATANELRDSWKKETECQKHRGNSKLPGKSSRKHPEGWQQYVMFLHFSKLELLRGQTICMGDSRENSVAGKKN